ncbi:hypothetical protein AX16_009215 [Volvariella volvacea WC 439]|nr:hypothetical protein AX16_009215 [Volvariella volvacea WC 439]
MLAKFLFPVLCLSSLVSADAHFDFGHWPRQSVLTPSAARQIFEPIGNGNSSVFFSEHVAEDGRYFSLASFQAATFNVVNGILTEPIRLVTVFDHIVVGNTAVLELQ